MPPAISRGEESRAMIRRMITISHPEGKANANRFII
jgi:hypothetical protein